MPSSTWWPSHLEIIEFCAQNRGNTNNIILLDPQTGQPTLFVKYGDITLLEEAATQEYFFHLAKCDCSAPRIPEVYDHFADTRGCAYVIMEYIFGATVEDWVKQGNQASREELAPSIVAPAVQWLLSRQPPENSTLGPIGGGTAQHHFFVDGQAPLAFASVDALQAYIDAALQRAPRYARTSLDISHEPLEICHSDVKKDNFIIDQEGNVCVVDFQHVGVLPKPFASYGLYNTGNTFSARVGQMIKHPQYKYASEMVYVAGLILQSGGSCFGLDKNGQYVKPKMTGSWSTHASTWTRDEVSAGW